MRISLTKSLAFCRDLGADHTVRYTEPDFTDAFKAACKGGADVVLDMAGGRFSEPALRATGYAGRFVVVGFAASSPTRIPLNLFLFRGFSIVGYKIAVFERRTGSAVGGREGKAENHLSRTSLTSSITHSQREERQEIDRRTG